MFCHECPAGVTVPPAMRDRFGFPADVLRRSEDHRRVVREIVDAVRLNRLWHGHFHCRYRTALNAAGYRAVVDGPGGTHDPIDIDLVVVDLADLGFHRHSGPSARQFRPA